MPESDFEFRHLLKSAQMSSEKNGRAKHMHVILKGGNAVSDRYKRFFGLADKRISTDGLCVWVQQSLDNWLNLIVGAK